MLIFAIEDSGTKYISISTLKELLTTIKSMGDNVIIKGYNRKYDNEHRYIIEKNKKGDY